VQLDTVTIVSILALLLVAAIILWFLYHLRRTTALRDRFGKEEYQRTLETHGARRKAEASLLAREKRVAGLDLRPFDPEERQRFGREWTQVRSSFLDDPENAVTRASALLDAMLAARGYLGDGFDARYEALTVDHGDSARHYLAGHEIAQRQARGQASTEEMRQALIHYEALFERLAREPAPAEVEAA
jgi:hypothetical protein